MGVEGCVIHVIQGELCLNSDILTSYPANKTKSKRYHTTNTGYLKGEVLAGLCINNIYLHRHKNQLSPSEPKLSNAHVNVEFVELSIKGAATQAEQFSRFHSTPGSLFKRHKKRLFFIDR